MDSLGDPVLVVAGDRTIVDLNAAALRLAGSPAEWAGRAADSLFPFLAGAAIAGPGAPREQTLAAAERTWDVRVSRARADRAVWIVVLRDVSEQHSAMREREQFVVQNNELVSRVSHELRSPVTAIRGALELVLAKDPSTLDDEDRHLLDAALRSCDRLARIVHEIVDLSTIDRRRAPGTLEALPVERLLVDAVLDVGRIASSRGVRLQTSVEHGLRPVLGEHDRLVQVIVDLASGAVERAPRGAEITLAAASDADCVVVRVDDAAGASGAPTIEPTLRALVERQGGRVTVAPHHVAIHVPEAPQRRAGRGAVVTGARLLVADDDDDLRAVVVEALRAQGFEVLEAADGRQASDLLARERVDLAILDITMPHQRGDQVIGDVRAGTLQPRLPILVLTGTIDERQTPASLGADAVLTKPANLKRLVGEVRALLTSARG